MPTIQLVTLLIAFVLTQGGAPKKYIPTIAESIIKHSYANDLDPLLVTSVMYHESRLKPWARSRSHDHGLMQIHCPYKTYAPWCRNTKKLRSIDYNIKIGTLILAKRRDRCKKEKHQHKSHWVRHYNWHDKTYDKKIWKILNIIVLWADYFFMEKAMEEANSVKRR